MHGISSAPKKTSWIERDLNKNALSTKITHQRRKLVLGRKLTIKVIPKVTRIQQTILGYFIQKNYHYTYQAVGSTCFLQLHRLRDWNHKWSVINRLPFLNELSYSINILFKITRRSSMTSMVYETLYYISIQSMVQSVIDRKWVIHWLYGSYLTLYIRLHNKQIPSSVFTNKHNI